MTLMRRLSQANSQNHSTTLKGEKNASDGGRIWLQAIVAGVSAWLVAIMTAAPSLKDINLDWIKITRAGDYLKQCVNPLERDLNEVILAYRVFPPLLAHLLGAGEIVSLLLPYFATAAMLGVVFAAIRQRLDIPHAWAGTLLVASTSAVTWPNCMVGYPDSFSHLFAAILLLSRSRPLIFVCVVCGIFTDERFVLALPFIWLWHGGYGTSSLWKMQDWVTVGAALLCCVVLRHGLKAGWIGAGIPASKTYSDMLPSLLSFRPCDQSWAMWAVNVFGGFRWAWFLLLGSVVLAWRSGPRINILVFLVGLLAAAGGSLLVFDVTRSIGFAFPSILVGMTWLSQSDRVKSLSATRWIAAFCLVTPSYWITSGFFFWWWRPLPLRLLAYWTGEDPMRWLPW